MGGDSEKGSPAVAAPSTASTSRPSDGPSVAVWREVLHERLRQQRVEGWSAEHDDSHDGGGLACAAACYAYAGGLLDREFVNPPNKAFVKFPHQIRTMWPWDWKWWKPKDARRDLVRAAALILAEIERLDRTVGSAPPSDEGGSTNTSSSSPPPSSKERA